MGVTARELLAAVVGMGMYNQADFQPCEKGSEMARKMVQMYTKDKPASLSSLGDVFAEDENEEKNIQNEDVDPPSTSGQQAEQVQEALQEANRTADPSLGSANPDICEVLV